MVKILNPLRKVNASLGGDVTGMLDCESAFRPASCWQTIMSKCAVLQYSSSGSSASFTLKGECFLQSDSVYWPSNHPCAIQHGTGSANWLVFLYVSIVPIPSSNEEIRLVDDAFGKICHMVSDGSWVVRVQAAKLLVSVWKWLVWCYFTFHLCLKRNGRMFKNHRGRFLP